MRRFGPIALAILLATFLAACGDDGGEPAETGSDGSTAAVEATVDDLLLETGDPTAVCRAMSPRQLRESYGGWRGDPLERCEGVAERRPDTGLTTYEVAEVEGECARVDVADQDGNEAVLFMREIDGRWLINDIEEPPLSEVVDPVCGGVHLFEK